MTIEDDPDFLHFVTEKMSRIFEDISATQAVENKSFLGCHTRSSTFLCGKIDKNLQQKKNKKSKKTLNYIWVDTRQNAPEIMVMFQNLTKKREKIIQSSRAPTQCLIHLNH